MQGRGWRFLVAGLAILSGMPLMASSNTPQTPADTVLIEVEGTLTVGDEILSDGSLYDVYAFEGEAGQVFTIQMTSSAFDTYLIWVDSGGQTLGENDDTSLDDTNSTLTLVLPETGQYRVFANAFANTGRGNYQLTITSVSDRDALGLEAFRIFELGLDLRSAGQIEAALQAWQQSLALYQILEAPQGIAYSLSNLGVAYGALGQNQQAIVYYSQALEIVRELGDRPNELIALSNLGLAHSALGDYQQAIDFHRQQLAIARDNSVRDAFPAESRRSEADALNSLGLAYDALGQYPEAIDHHQQALAIERELDNRQGEAGSLNNLGLTYSSLGQYPEAIEVYQQSLAIKQAIGDRQGEASTLGNLGNAYDALGQFQRAIEFHQQSLAIDREVGDRQGEANSLGNLGITYNAIGQYQRAIEFHQQSLAIDREIGSRQGESDSLGNLGNVYYALGDYQQAIEFYQQFLALAGELGDRGGEATALGNLGIVYEVLGEYAQAIEFHQQNLAISRELGSRLGEADALSNLGLVYNALGQHQQAIELHQQAIAIDREVGDRQGEAISLNNLGLTFLRTNQLAEAETALTQSITTYEALRADLSDIQLISLADTQTTAYELLMQTLTAQGNPSAALAISERGRAQAFALQLALRQDDSSTEAPTTFPTLAEIQTIARRQNATLVEYALIDQQDLYIWVVQPSGEVTFRALELDGLNGFPGAIATLDTPIYRGGSPSALDVLVTDSRRGISVVEETGSNNSSEYLKDLHQLLIDPIADLLPTDPEANVVFVPQGSLFLVPFAALQDANGTYLIEKHTVLTAPSIQVLGLAAREEQVATRGQPLADALIVGNPVMPEVWIPAENGLQEIQLAPLPGTEVEALAIGGFLNTSPLIGTQATEAQVKQQMPGADLIHLATHGLLEYGNPETSGVIDVPGAVALTPGNGEDGLLTAAEILEMDLQAQMAILSACDTGLGRITGDGVVGLSRALITAGVPSVIVSLWAVPDAPTAALMTEFYNQLQAGQPKAQALRQAMLITLENHPEPRNWAAFTLIGAAD
ncbi:MAG: tetratricopeptide repeat protein [Cyanobacteria bacterium J06635_15]